MMTSPDPPFHAGHWFPPPSPVFAALFPGEYVTDGEFPPIALVTGLPLIDEVDPGPPAQYVGGLCLGAGPL